MTKNIAAWTDTITPQTGYVQYISINRTGDSDALVEITVRQGDLQQAIITMRKDEFALLLLQAARKV
jgi:hypothetical protein